MADGENVSRFAIVVPRTLSVPPAQRHWLETTKGYAVIPVQYYSAAKLNRPNLNGNFNPQ